MSEDKERADSNENGNNEKERHRSGELFRTIRHDCVQADGQGRAAGGIHDDGGGQFSKAENEREYPRRHERRSHQRQYNVSGELHGSCAFNSRCFFIRDWNLCER